MIEGIDNTIFFWTLFSEFTTGVSKSKLLPIICVVENRSLCDAIESNKCVAEKRLCLEIANVKELTKYEKISKIKWADAKSQLTKKGANTRNLFIALILGHCLNVNSC